MITQTKVQEYDRYTSEDFAVWRLLFEEQMQFLPQIASANYLEGLKNIQFTADKIPNFDDINRILGQFTGWKVFVVPGIIEAKPFFQHLADKEFPATTWLRTMEQLKYIKEPDMFHDVFGHVPILSDAYFCKFLQGLSEIALDNIENTSVIEMMSRLYWFTVEFGLIQEEGMVKIYGAGLMSSPGESKFSLSDTKLHRPFSVEEVLNTPYFNDRYQVNYFVAASYEQLYNCLPELRETVERYVKEGRVFNAAKEGM